jgi:hypothetical protein
MPSSDDAGGLAARAVQQAGVALLRHGAGDIGVAAAFLQQDPGARLRILRHDVLDEGAGMQRDAGDDGADFHRQSAAEICAAS